MLQRPHSSKTWTHIKFELSWFVQQQRDIIVHDYILALEDKRAIYACAVPVNPRANTHGCELLCNSAKPINNIHAGTGYKQI